MLRLSPQLCYTGHILFYVAMNLKLSKFDNFFLSKEILCL